MNSTYNLREVANLAELFKSCKYLSPLNVVCVLKIITFRFTLNYNISFYNSLTFRFGGLTEPTKLDTLIFSLFHKAYSISLLVAPYLISHAPQRNNFNTVGTRISHYTACYHHKQIWLTKSNLLFFCIVLLDQTFNF